ncbi:MAG: Fur family transcriptional regulator [Chthoniobacterales bacterium]
MAYATQQKDVILRVLKATKQPLTPMEICEIARKEIPSIGIATVYRSLKKFTEENLVRLVEVPGASPHYEHQVSTHHHFFLCQTCHKLFKLVGCVKGVKDLAPENFQVTEHEIVLYGVCAECRSENAAASEE